MTLLPATLVELAAAGASLRVDAKKLSTHQLNQLAAGVAGAGGRLVIVHADNLVPDQARALAQIGGDAIEFDLA